MKEYSLSHLQELEAESIHIIREVAAEFENPVMLYSIGKDSSVMVRLAEKAFAPGKVPFPLMHIDSKWKFKEMIQFRDEYAKKYGWNLIVESNMEAFRAGVGPFTHGSKVHTDLMKTKALLDALRDDDSLRQDCMDVLELSSACRRSKEHPDAEAALREFHQQHGARRVALNPCVSHRRLWAVAAAVLVLVGLSALLLPRLSEQEPLAGQAASTLSPQPVLLADGDREMPVSMESMFKPVAFATQPKTTREEPVNAVLFPV